VPAAVIRKLNERQARVSIVLVMTTNALESVMVPHMRGHASHGEEYEPDDFDLRQRILSEMHDQTLAGHTGVCKTLERLSRVAAILLL
jgi:hypothetical protein